MHPSHPRYDDRYHRDRDSHDLALRMIRHEARTCTIRSCTGLTDDRIRRLYKDYAFRLASPVRRRRGKSPRRAAFFTRNTHVQFETSLLVGLYRSFDLLRVEPRRADPIAFGLRFCDAYETHRQLLRTSAISFEHAWFLLELMSRSGTLHLCRCRTCDAHFVRDVASALRRSCPVCRLRRASARGGARA